MRNIVIFLFVFFSTYVVGQKYDYRWVMGIPYQSGSQGIGNFDITFPQTGADTFATTRGVEMDNSQTTISDSSANLLFYTNGARIYTSTNDTMEHGDSINYGTFWNLYNGVAYDALEEIIGLPTDSMSIWNLLHYYMEVGDSSIWVWRIYQTQIDMSKNSGLGEVLFKDKTLIQDTLGSYITACRHGNGRDWWILSSKTSSNCLYELLVQPDTVMNLGTQCLGSNYISEDAGQAAFSPDGSKFAWEGCAGGVNIYDFDRCSGQLNNPIHLPLYAGQLDGVWDLQYGLAFSPNSRFLYIAQNNNIIQFDTDTSDVWGSLDTVGFYQSPPPNNPPGYYFLMQLAPDGKIYISASNGIMFLHVINQPDLKGDSCTFVNYGFALPDFNSFGLPSFPNYRLGVLPGSPCDTIYKTDTTAATSIHQGMDERILKIFPNPANDYTIIDYGFTDWSKGIVTLEIRNSLGEKVHEEQLPMYSGFQRIDLSKFSSDMYTAFIKRSTGVVASEKFVKQ
jgi:hypothetical protein